jgi:hypothetical protein
VLYEYVPNGPACPSPAARCPSSVRQQPPVKSRVVLGPESFSAAGTGEVLYALSRLEAPSSCVTLTTICIFRIQVGHRHSKASWKQGLETTGNESNRSASPCSPPECHNVESPPESLTLRRPSDCTTVAPVDPPPVRHVYSARCACRRFLPSRSPGARSGSAYALYLGAGLNGCTPERVPAA